MSPRTQNLFAILSIVAALASFAMFMGFSWRVTQTRGERAAAMQQVSQASALQASADRTRALVASTQADRDALSGFLSTDIVSIATLISDVGKSTGAEIQVSAALPQGVVVPATANAPAVSAVGFIVEAKGSFTQLMRTEKLLENLPVPSRIQQFDIQTTPSPGASGQWHMGVSLQVVTTAAVSS